MLNGIQRVKLSIIIAAYNVSKFIERCVSSCANQDIKKELYEIIVIDDGSTDETFELLNVFEQDNINLKLIRQENKGLGGARNTGIKHSNGEYIWLIDGDDYIENNCLGTIVEILDRNNLDVLVLNYSVIKENDIITSHATNNVILSSVITSGGDYYRNNYFKSYSWLFVVRKVIFTANNLFFQERINLQDSEILPKLLNHVSRLTYLDKVCYYYVQRIDSYTNSNNEQKRYNYFLSIIKVRNSLNDFLGEITCLNPKLADGIKMKLKALHQVVFNHLIFFTYKKEWLVKIIQLLGESDFYPLKHDATGKMKFIKWGLNHYPVFTKQLIDKIKQILQQ